VTLVFNSDGETPIGTLSTGSFEDGTVQLMGGLAWSNGTMTLTDTIQFQSEVETPEASTGILLLAGIGLLMFRAKLRG
jgi:hypothetical protein